MTRRANDDEVQKELEMLRNEVRVLRTAKTKLSTSKKAVIKELRLSEDDVLFLGYGDRIYYGLFISSVQVPSRWMDGYRSNR